MKQLALVFFFFLIEGVGFGQSVDKLINEKKVTRIIKTLTADNMMGRPASKPQYIEKATAYIESQFKKAGLLPLIGQKNFRQVFLKTQIQPLSQKVIIDGQPVDSKNALIVTEKAELQVSSGLTLKRIPYDSTVQNKDQYFFDLAFKLIRDTSSVLVLIDAKFERNFNELKGFYKQRFANNRKAIKVFVVGVTAATRYSIQASQKTEAIQMTNVVGILPGKTKPNEFVVFSGHYDHLGIQSALAGDSIANGADDDASGTTAVIALASYFKKINSNERTLIFVAFTAEEIGG